MRRLRRPFFARPSTTVAPELLNKLLVAGASVGRIVEVEAYMADDPASHAFRGQTRRNATMFGKAGVLYVYFTYGMHHCANIVTGSVGDGQAVLLRAVTPVAGVDEIRARRPGRADRSLTDGPGKLCQAFGLDLRHDRLDLCASAVGRLDRRRRRPAARSATSRSAGRYQRRGRAAVALAGPLSCWRPVRRDASASTNRGGGRRQGDRPGGRRRAIARA